MLESRFLVFVLASLFILFSELARADYFFETELQQRLIQSKDKVNFGSADIRNQWGLAISPGLFKRKSAKEIYGMGLFLEWDRFLQISGGSTRLSKLDKLTYGGKFFYDYNLARNLNLEGRFQLRTAIFPRASTTANRIDLKDAFVPLLELAPRYLFLKISSYRLLGEGLVGIFLPSVFSDVETKISLEYGVKILLTKPQNNWGLHLQYLNQKLESEFSDDLQKRISAGAVLWF
jgi:hypothetical protein